MKRWNLVAMQHRFRESWGHDLAGVRVVLPGRGGMVFQSVGHCRSLALPGALALALAACAPIAPKLQNQPDLAMSPGAIRAPIILPPTEIASLKNLTDAELVARLGQPDFTRQDTPAQLWQYRGATCVLDLFLYPDGAGLKVAHATSRARNLDTAATADQTPCSPFTPQTASAN